MRIPRFAPENPHISGEVALLTLSENESLFEVRVLVVVDRMMAVQESRAIC